MYRNKFIASLKLDGKILREQDGSIKLPFGSEYSIFLKNLESRNAVVNISIDGEDVLGGNRLVVKANDSTELKGFMQNQTAKNKFKFIKRSQKIENHRGIHIDDGLIRIEFQFEKLEPITQDINYRYCNDYWYYEPHYPIATWNNNNSFYRISDCVGSGTAVNCGVQNSYTVTLDSCDMAVNEEPGITTKGSYIDQEFGLCNTKQLEDQSHVIILKLVGHNKDGNTVEKPVFTKEKIVCPVCGGRNRSLNRFCFECGTALQ